LIVFDIAMNELESIQGLEHNLQLMELWANQNKIESRDSLNLLKDLPEIECVYFGHNPVAKEAEKSEWQSFLKGLMPNLKQIDDEILRGKAQISFQQPIIKGLIRKEGDIPREAKKILEQVVRVQQR